MKMEISRRDFFKATGLGTATIASLTVPSIRAQVGGASTDTSVLVIEGGTLIDGTGKAPVAETTILIERGRIVRIGKKGELKNPSGARIIQATGKYILPGLIDSHVHYDEPWLHRLYLANGVTTVRDMSAPLERITTLRQELNVGNIVGPRMVISGMAISPPTVKAMGLGSAREMAQKMIDAGVDGIKVTNYTAAELKEVTDLAHANGLIVYGHTGPKVGGRGPGARLAVENGLDGVEHMYGILEDSMDGELSLPSDFDPGRTDQLFRHYYARMYRRHNPAKVDALLQLMVQRNVYLSPTLITTDRRVRGTAALKGDPALKHIPGEIAETSSLDPADAEEDENWKNSFRLMQAVVLKFQKAGGLLIVGTDSSGREAGRALHPGWSLYREMEVYVQAGLSPMQVLQAATLNNAKVLGKAQELGTVEAGKLADLVVLNANPLEDIKNVGRIHLVVKDGMILDPPALLEQNLKQFGRRGERRFDRFKRVY